MKVAIITGQCPPGECGVGDQAACLCDALRQLGAEIELITGDTWRLVDLPEIRRSLRACHADLLHFQYPTLGFGRNLGPQAVTLLTRSVVTLHEASQAHLLRKLALYPFTFRPRHIVFTTEYERRFVLKWAPWIAKRSSVIPVGNNIAGSRRSLQPSLDEIVYFGLVRPQKGMEQVIELAAMIQRSALPLRVRVIGRPDPKNAAYFHHLQSQAAKLPICWEPDLTDEQVSHCLASASIAYLPYPDGASGRRTTLKAALAHGVTVITTEGPHTPADLRDVVIFAANPEQALGWIRKLQVSPELRSSYRDRAAAYMQQFAWDRIARLHLQLYEHLMAQRTSTAACP